jgi:phosphoribosylformylglycinamidine synthase
MAVAISEMAMAAQIGCRITIESELRSDFLLFSETPGFVLEVPASEVTQVLARFEALGIWCRAIGETHTQPVIAFNDIVSIPLESATRAWVSGLRDKTI